MGLSFNFNFQSRFKLNSEVVLPDDDSLKPALYQGLVEGLLLESVLYGMKSLIFAIPISLIIHYVMYSMISKGMTPFVFYINWGAYGIAVIMVALVVVMAMLFSLRSIEKVEIVKELKLGACSSRQSGIKHIS